LGGSGTEALCEGWGVVKTKKPVKKPRPTLVTRTEPHRSNGTIVDLVDAEKNLVLDGDLLGAIRAIRKRCQIGLWDAKDSMNRWRVGE
jgi:hypothetical protein